VIGKTDKMSDTSTTFTAAVLRDQKVEQKPEMVKGCYIRPKPGKPSVNTFESDVMVNLKKKGYVGVVTYYAPKGRDYQNYDYCQVQFEPSDLNDMPMAFGYCAQDLDVITKEDYDKTILEIRKARAQAEKEAAEKLKAVISLKRLPVAKREYTPTQAKDFLNTNLNYIKLHTRLGADGLPTNLGSMYPDAVCCSLTKTTNHIEVLVPKDWINYYGYTLLDLKMWLGFLREIEGLDFQGKYIGTTTLKKEFDGTTKVINSRLPKFPQGNTYVVPDMECYKVLIPNGGRTALENYMHFILVRYMYNISYWNIPTLAIQMKKILKEKISNWEALMVAHMSQIYNGYYCLVANDTNKTALPVAANSPANVRSRLSTGMNAAFSYGKVDNAAILEIIKSKNYKQLLKYLKEWRGDK
jgi:hypothetical protein